MEVEVSLVPGLPDLKILGLPDTNIKESKERIKSAIKYQGFDWPKAKKILVQLKPSEIKKSSKGLELAIALGILGEMGQLESDLKDCYIYGELSLKGEVKTPSDIIDTPVLDRPIITGKMQGLPTSTQQFSSLSEYKSLEFIEKSDPRSSFVRPPLPVEYISEDQLRILSVIGAGEHHTLFIGPPGTGKTTSAQLVSCSLNDPSENLFRDSERIWRRQKKKLTWRPIVAPHHTSSNLAVVGGGQPPSPGEITRAHGGTLILDELLEFSPNVQEALREPLESGKVRLSRGASVQEFPADFLLVATSNLCPCGYFVPESGHQCRCRTQKLIRYLEKFSGPILDRFQCIVFFKKAPMEGERVHSSGVQKEIIRMRRFAKTSRSQDGPNSKASFERLLNGLTGQAEIEYFEDLARSESIRRKFALLKLSRSFADFEESEEIRLNHINDARKLSIDTLRALRIDAFKFI